MVFHTLELGKICFILSTASLRLHGALEEAGDRMRIFVHVPPTLHQTQAFILWRRRTYSHTMPQDCRILICFEYCYMNFSCLSEGKILIEFFKPIARRATSEVGVGRFRELNGSRNRDYVRNQGVRGKRGVWTIGRRFPLVSN